VAPLAFGVMLRHAARALGLRRAVLEMAVLTAYGFALEWTAMAVFSTYRYSATWTVAPAGIPLAIALMWSAIILAAMALAVRAGARSPVRRAALAAALAIALDLLMEPTASRLHLWQWTPPGPWLGVPLGNFVGWMVLVGGYAWGAERDVDEASIARMFLRRIVLALSTIAGLVVVGFTWRTLHAERRLAGAADWCAWAILVCAPVLLSRRPATDDPGPPPLAVRLGRQSGAAPLVVFVLVAATFVVDAAMLGGRDLVIVAVGTCASLALSLCRHGGARVFAPSRLLEQLFE
jgi:hypothetical protein